MFSFDSKAANHELSISFSSWQTGFSYETESSGCVSWRLDWELEQVGSVRKKVQIILNWCSPRTENVREKNYVALHSTRWGHRYKQNLTKYCELNFKGDEHKKHTNVYQCMLLSQSNRTFSLLDAMAPATLDWRAIIRQKGGKNSEASRRLLGQACNANTNKMNYGCFQNYFEGIWSCLLL